MPDYDKQIPEVFSSPALCETSAALFLGVSVSSLRKSRMNGARTNHLPPPPFHKLGRRVIYRRDDLVSYLEKHRALVQ